MSQRKSEPPPFLLRYEPGAAIYKQGVLGYEMFFVHAGKVELVTSPEKEGGYRQYRHAGEFFGEEAVLEGKPYRQTARADGLTSLLSIHSDSLDLLLRRHRDASRAMLKQFSARARAAAVIETSQQTGTAQLIGTAQPAKVHEPDPSSKGGSFRAEQPSLATQCYLAHDASGTLFQLTTKSHAIIGRYDQETEGRPDIDLSTLKEALSVSRRHASLRIDEGRLWLREEEGAHNGTYINDDTVESEWREVREGDQLRFGLAVFTLRRKTEES